MSKGKEFSWYTAIISNSKERVDVRRYIALKAKENYRNISKLYYQYVLEAIASIRQDQFGNERGKNLHIVFLNKESITNGF